MSEIEFKAPGPGVWELEQTHFSRPATRYISSVAAGALSRGFAEGTKRYGLLLDTLYMMPVNDFIYSQFRPVGAPPGAKGPPPKLIFKLITRLHPQIRERVRTGGEVFTKRPWREDLSRWDNEIKPDSIRRNQGLQNTQVQNLGDSEFAKHLEALRDNHAEMTYRHHIFTISCAFPVGHFLVEASRMTGLSSGEILGLLKGSAPVSAGIATEELAEVGRAMHESGVKASDFQGRPPAEVLAELRSRPDALGKAVGDFLDRVGYRMVSGYDVSEKYALEMPDMLLRTLFADPARTDDRKAEMDTRVDRVRSKVPQAERARFDELLNEARFINRLRDERGMYNDLWSIGLARRGILEAGRRLQQNGRLPEADLAINANHDELLELLSGSGGPSVEELRRRRTWRETKTIADAPPYLGGSPSGPPPVDWLPAKAQAPARAMEKIIKEMFEVPERKAVPRAVEGMPVHPGVYEGPARLVKGPADFNRLQQGDVLVTSNTGPAFNVVLPLLGAIVTDRGGQLSHAAIVAREYGLPAVVGTRSATTTFPDGARVRVDGDKGRVELIG